MKALAIAGIVLVTSVVLFAHYSMEDYNQYLSLQREADEEVIECADLTCFGMGRYAFEAKERFKNAMYELLAGMTLGSVGLVFLGLNIRDLAKPEDI